MYFFKEECKNNEIKIGGVVVFFFNNNLIIRNKKNDGCI